MIRIIICLFFSINLLTASALADYKEVKKQFQELGKYVAKGAVIGAGLGGASASIDTLISFPVNFASEKMDVKSLNKFASKLALSKKINRLAENFHVTLAEDIIDPYDRSGRSFDERVYWVFGTIVNGAVLGGFMGGSVFIIQKSSEYYDKHFTK